MTPETLLEASWAGRGRAIRGRELRIELAVTAVFLAAAIALAVTSTWPTDIHPAAVAGVLALALAARVEFPIGAGFLVPTQIFLVPLFVVAPAQIVPVLVLAAYALAALAAAAGGRASVDRVVFAAGDAFHAFGPALVLVLLADGDATAAGVGVIVLAFAAQLLADLASSSLHELVTMGARPVVHLRTLLEVWTVDLALSTIGLLAADEAAEHGWAAIAPLPFVLLLRAMAVDRTRRIDTAQQRRIALERERSRREADAQLIERQNQFLQDASHELRTPLTIARGHLETMRRTRGTTPEVEVAADELARIERIVERLLLLAQAGAPVSAQLESLDAEALLEDRFVRWSDTIERPWQLDALCAGTLVADGDALRAALDALLENAVKHTTTTQTIRLGSRVVDGGLQIEVQDAGNGIPEEALGRIFDRFARADSARNREVGGVGLGLALVQAVTTAHGGDCAVRSSPAGSTFTLWLPSFTAAPSVV